MDARQSRRGKRISLQQEKRAAAQLGGKTMAASGATRLGGGGDVRVMGKTRLECKITEKDTYTLRYVELEKVRKQAIKSLESPLFQFGFRHTNGRTTSFAVIPWIVGDKPSESDNSWMTSSRQMSFTEKQLEEALFKGRIQLTWVMPGNNPFEQRIFEIMRWHDYIERTTLKGSDA